jgi:hypothetical protein
MEPIPSADFLQSLANQIAMSRDYLSLMTTKRWLMLQWFSILPDSHFIPLAGYVKMRGSMVSLTTIEVFNYHAVIVRNRFRVR